MAGGSNVSRSTPLLGLAFLISAMTAGFPPAIRERSARSNPRGVPAARKLVATIAPADDDLSILKPRHSAFFGTPLEFLLDELHINQLIIAGLTTDNCVMFTAHDAYLRKLAVFVPSNCSAAKDPRDHRGALRHIRTVLKGRTARV